MKTVGFIDYYLDEWHANNYPKMINDLTNGEIQVKYVYGKIDSPNGITNKEWAKKYGAELLDNIEDVIVKSDYLIVLSPDNPEMHEELCELPLKSGKPVYVDKTFAPDKETAIRIFEHADKHGTPCFSSSALRFSSELKDINKENIYKVYSEGHGAYDMYSIHQIEPVVMLMNCRAKRVMGLGDVGHPSVIIEFEDGRVAQIHQCRETNFKITAVDKTNSAVEYPIKSDFFSYFMEALVEFFKTGKIPVEHSQTIDVIAIREAGCRALQKPYEWIEL
ncbi:MAG: Gfo/Idh/MocA family oxidoreductase [Clostridia bacterium]|nr:Gfo/Idh/MocA family oxidoreductase [Clostridia bacterium]